MRLLLDLDMDTARDTVTTVGEDIIFNFATALRIKHEEVRKFVETSLEFATRLGGANLEINRSLELINERFGSFVGRNELNTQGIDRLRDALAVFQSICHDYKFAKDWLPSNYAPFLSSESRTLVRYGNVELQALENYLEFPARTRDTFLHVIDNLNDENAMYLGARQRHHLSGDDIDWNLRKLMTNAGFYVQRDPDLAWVAFEAWAQAYRIGLVQCNLATYPPAYPFYFKIQRLIFEKYGVNARYVAHPGPFEFYEAITSKRVLFISPLADLAVKQKNSGRLSRFYNDYVVPDFYLVGLDAYVSTWPNRPHLDWLDTFSKICNQIDTAIKEHACDIVVASCGCYGIPICSYVKTKHKIDAIYLGNITNAYFGVRQNATANLFADKVNAHMWIDGDLQRYKNVDRIDNGRYV